MQDVTEQRRQSTLCTVQRWHIQHAHSLDLDPTASIFAIFGRDLVGPLVGGTALKNKMVLPEEWQKKFCMLRTSVVSLCTLLRPHIKGQTTVTRSPISSVKQVACTLYNLADEGKL